MSHGPAPALARGRALSAPAGTMFTTTLHNHTCTSQYVRALCIALTGTEGLGPRPVCPSQTDGPKQSRIRDARRHSSATMLRAIRANWLFRRKRCFRVGVRGALQNEEARGTDDHFDDREGLSLNLTTSGLRLLESSAKISDNLSKASLNWAILRSAEESSNG
jgi:hypothetical protein